MVYWRLLGTGSRSRAQQNSALFDLALDDDDHREIDGALVALTIPPGDMYDIERDVEGCHSGIIKMNLHDAADNQ